jgi:hypothetical protein
MDFEPVNNDEYQRLMAVLKANAGKSFVQRILRPSEFPTMDSGDGGIATHRMAWGQTGPNKYVVHPTVLMTDQGGLHDYGDKAWEHAHRSGNFIEFDNPQDAEFFANRYKGAWGGLMNKPPK